MDQRRVDTIVAKALNRGFTLAPVTTRDHYPIVYRSQVLNGHEIVQKIHVITEGCSLRFTEDESWPVPCFPTSYHIPPLLSEALEYYANQIVT